MRALLALILAWPVLVAGQQAPASAPGQAPASSKIWIGHEAEFEQFLKTAEIQKIVDIGQGVTRPRRAFFAPGGLAGSAIIKAIDDGPMAAYLDSWKSEIAAYELDKLLDMGMVPPTVERRVEGDRRSVQLWVENTQSLKKLEGKVAPDIGAWNRQVYRQRIFDDLIINDDRNAGNILVDPAWNVILIDHSRAFDTRKNKMPAPLSKIDRPFFEKLKALDKDTLKARIGPYVTFGVDKILQRRDRIVKELEKLIAEHGEADVLIQ
jgi:hypothetical protein